MQLLDAMNVHIYQKFYDQHEKLRDGWTDVEEWTK